MINYRLIYLKISIRRWEALCALTAQELAAEGFEDTRKKKKKRTTNAKNVNAQCGFDVRLVYDLKEWAAWTASEEGRAVVSEGIEEAGMDIIAGVCLNPRKKCERHSGWQKVREADFEVEKAVLVSGSCSSPSGPRLVLSGLTY